MKKAMQPYRKPNREPEEDPEDSHFTYGRPSAPAWIAAAAVAFAFFLLGGFIKTYRQLEALRDESRQEIADLREAIRRLQAQSTSTVPIRPAAPLAQLEPIPAAPARMQRLPRPDRGRDPRTALRQEPRFPQGEPAGRHPASRSVSVEPVVSAADLALRNLPSGVGFDFGPDTAASTFRQAAPMGDGTPPEAELPPSPAGGGYQVVSISNAQKRVMVEGGRDLGLGEGTRLELTRDGRWIADLRVVDVFANQSSCEVLQASLNPEPGDTIRRPVRNR